jgi:predicted kinase
MFRSDIDSEICEPVSVDVNEALVEAIIFTGIQGSGKSTFYYQRFFHTHCRINLDMLRTRRREDILINACIQAGQRFVVDNTNPTRESREKYIDVAQAADFRLISYYFIPVTEEALQRNAEREGRQRVPDKAIRATASRLEVPTSDEGFDEIYTARIDHLGVFQVERLYPDPDSAKKHGAPDAG